jgi:RsiW-degrading membrane proteinase PrsW (M82 family)
MISLLIKAPILGILTAFLAVVAEQLIAVFANIFWQKEIIFSFYGQLSYFLFAAVIIEEGLKYLAIRFPLRNNFGLSGVRFVFGSLTTGFFFGLTEVWLVTASNKEYLAGLWSHDSEILFSLIAIILIQALTALLIGSIIAGKIFHPRFIALKIILFPVFIHLLFNFLVIQKGNFTNALVFITLFLTFLISLSILAFNFKRLD